MRNFVLFFTLLCFQISKGEGVSETDRLYDVGENHVIPFPGKEGVEFEEPNEEKSADWTEEDEKWFEEIQNQLAEDSDEAENDKSYLEVGKLIQEIEKLMNEHHPEKGSYEWLVEIVKWFYAADDDYDDDLDDEIDEGLADFYSWIYQKNIEGAKKSERLLQKRFSSV